MEGFGYIQAECINFIRKQNKGYTATLSDDESEDDSSVKKVNNMVAFTTYMVYKLSDQNDGESSDEELSYDDVTESYRQLYVKWKEEHLNGEKQKAKKSIASRED